LLVFEQALEEHSEPVGACDQSCLASSEYPGLDAMVRPTVPEANPVEPGVRVQVVVPVVATAGLKQHPFVTAHGESSIVLSYR
jgi:hypothetical protein